VEDVLNLGDEVTVRVDDIDNSGKLSLSLAGDLAGDEAGSDKPADKAEGDGGEWVGSDAPRERSARPERASAPAGDVEVASFDDAWDSKAREEFGDLGPADEGRSGGGDRGGERRGGGGGGGGRRRGGRR
jgi:polyribonucleotide nucleotidyltransferase